MDCLFCHGKIPRWRRLKTSSQFCCDEHAEQHKNETVNRLLEYSDARPAHGAEDPIHRLALIGSETPIEERPAPQWQLAPFSTLELRRHLPTVANRLAAPGHCLAEPQTPSVLVLPTLQLWQKAAPVRAAAPAPRVESRTSLPELGLAEPVWIDPRLLDPGISSGITPAALALWPRLPESPRNPLRSLSPLVPAGIAARTRFLAGSDMTAPGATGRATSRRADVPLACWAPSGGMIAALHRSPSVIPSRGSALGAAQRGQFLPMVAQAVLHAAPASVAGPGLQSVVASTPQVVSVRFEASALASGGKQPARFCNVTSDWRDFVAQPWRAVTAALGPDHAWRVEWTPVLPERRKIGNLPDVARGGPLPISTPLSIAAPAPAMRAKRASPIAAELGFNLHREQAPAFLRQALPHVQLRRALRPASPLLAHCQPAAIAARGLKSGLDLQSPMLGACLLGAPRNFRGVAAAPQASGALAASAAAAAPQHQALDTFGPQGPVPGVPSVHSRLAPHAIGPSPSAGPAEPVSSRIADLAPWQPLEPHETRPQATALHTVAELVTLPSQAHLPRGSGLNVLSAESTPSRITTARLAAGQPLDPCESRPQAVALRAHAEPATVASRAPLPPASGLAALSAGLSSGAVPAVLDAATAVAEWRRIESQAAAGGPGASLRVASAPMAASISPAPRGPASLAPGTIPLADAPLEARPKFAASSAIRENSEMLARHATPKYPALAACPTGMVPPAGLRSVEARAKLQPAAPLRNLVAFAPEAWLFDAIAPAPILERRPKPSRPRLEDPAEEFIPIPAPVADHSVREAAEHAERRRVINWSGVGELASYYWHDVLKPELSTHRGQRIAAAACVLIFVPLSLHLAHSSSMLAALGRPLQERSYYIQEEYFEAGAKNWTNPVVLTRRSDSLAEIKDGVTLYQPSMPWADYTFTFAGEIRRGSLGWAVRATDPRNFYAFKLTRTGKGKERKGTLARYAVINGSPEKALLAALPFELEDNRLYHVTMRASGDRITTIIEDRGVDSFSDSRLKTGGVGFFADTGEAGLVQSLSVSGNDDSEGRTIYWLISFWRSLTGLF
jgi:hypothetical protein